MPNRVQMATLLALGICGCSRADSAPAAKTEAVPSAIRSTSGSSSGSASPASSTAPPQRKSTHRPRLVGLDGKNSPRAAVVVDNRKRVYSTSLRTWVRRTPNAQAERLGYLRSGASVPIRSEQPAGKARCPGGWYAVEPEGYVCVGKRATLDKNHPIVVASQEHPPDHTRRLPYIYGTVRRPGPIYGRLPTDAELRKAESGVDDRMPRWLEAEGEIGASYAQHVWLGATDPDSVTVPDPAQLWQNRTSADVPSFLADFAPAPNIRLKKRDPEKLVIERMRPKVGYSFLRTFIHNGRRYGLSTDMKILPTDRLRPIQGSEFHGWQIPQEIDFPFAIIRRPGGYYKILKKGRLVKQDPAPYHAVTKLTGKQRFQGKVLHYETTDKRWLSDRDASRLDPAKRMPKWGTNGEKWIDVNLTKQTVVLYEGTKAVYATMISSGEAGLGDPKTTTATKRGIFRVHTKHIAATMASREVGEEFELRDVPYVQYFDKEGYALHGAYWHDRFGTPRSHGCLNLAPEDARRIFHWTEPQVPAGWHGVLMPLRGTILFVHP